MYKSSAIISKSANGALTINGVGRIDPLNQYQVSDHKTTSGLIQVMLEIEPWLPPHPV